jgi:AraC family ethanolamine operon transcriptional activator
MNFVLPNFLTVELSLFDPASLASAIQAGALEHTQLQKGIFTAQISHTLTNGCRTDWGKYNLSLLAQGEMPDDWIVVGLFLSGDGDWLLQGVTVKNGDIVISKEMSELCISLPPNCQWLCVQFPRSYIDSMGLIFPKKSSFIHLSGALRPDMKREVMALAPILGGDRRVLPNESECRWAHERLEQILWPQIFRYLNALNGSEFNQTTNYKKIVMLVNQWFDANTCSPLNMEVLCGELGISIWQLERAFHREYGMQPLRLLTLRRLAKVRHELMTKNQNVTQVAFAYGFPHLGRFAQLYKSYFGELPSKTFRNVNAKA